MVTSRQLPADLDALVRDELAPDERVLYATQPLAARRVVGSLLTWIFAVPWTGFSVFWTVAAATGVSVWWQIVFPLFGLPFVAVGLLMLSLPFWAWRSAQRTLYLVTDRRAVLFESTGSSAITVRSLRPETLLSRHRTERPDGSGDVILSEKAMRDSDGDSTVERIGFLAIPDVRAADDALETLVSGAEARTAAPRWSGRRPALA